MTTVKIRQYTGEVDNYVIANLINACAELDRVVDPLEQGISVCELQEELNTPSIDAEDGTFAAFCHCGIYPEENALRIQESEYRSQNC